MNSETTSIRLLRYLRPYRGRLILTALLMAGFAFSSGITIGMISPFVKVLFTPRPPAVSLAAPPRGDSSGATQAMIDAVTGGSSTTTATAHAEGHGIAARFSAWKNSLRT